MPIRLPQTNTEPPKTGASTRLPAISSAISTAPETKISTPMAPAPPAPSASARRVVGLRVIGSPQSRRPS
jgi:hypothetical protein